MGTGQVSGFEGGVASVESGLAEQSSVAGFVRSLGLGRGVSGYSLHVVPVALFAWLREHQDFRAVQGLLVLVQRLGHRIQHVVWHVGVYLACQFDEARAEVPFFGFP